MAGGCTDTHGTAAAAAAEHKTVEASKRHHKAPVKFPRFSKAWLVDFLLRRLITHSLLLLLHWGMLH